jgi:Fic family protein
MNRQSAGQYVTSVIKGEQVRTFVPDPLPPNPPLHGDPVTAHQIGLAHEALARLDGLMASPHDRERLSYLNARREAVLSSRIDGNGASLSDLLLLELGEAPRVPLDDVVEVSNHVAAMEHGLECLRTGTPLSTQLMREMHERLMAGARGAANFPGEYRRSQTWVGGARPGAARFAPPPHPRIEACMARLEEFLHDEPVRSDPLTKASLVQLQFELIHPFVSGNGRMGRLLVTMVLGRERVLREPLLFPSAFFERHRAEYFERLDRVRDEGEWDEWLLFFARGMEESATEAFAGARRLREIGASDRGRVAAIGRLARSALRVHEALLSRPITTVAKSAQFTGLSVPAVTASLMALIDLGIVRERTGRRRGRVFAYERYLEALQ